MVVEAGSLEDGLALAGDGGEKPQHSILLDICSTTLGNELLKERRIESILLSIFHLFIRVIHKTKGEDPCELQIPKARNSGENPGLSYGTNEKKDFNV